MKFLSFLTATLLIIPSVCFTSCSSEDIMTTVDERVIATAEVEFVDEFEDTDYCIIYDGYVESRANLVDSATFFKLFGKYISSEERVIAETTPNANVSRSDDRPTFNVTSTKVRDYYEVTISLGKLSVVYETDYLYEFPQKTADLEKEYHVKYKLDKGEHIGESYVYRPNDKLLSVSVDVLTKIGSKYDNTSRGFVVKIDGGKFILSNRW